MSTKLCIEVSSVARPQKQEVEFMYIEEWTADTEIKLLQKVHELLSMVRDDGISLKINLDIQVKDSEHSFFLIKKKLDQSANVTIRNYTLSLREVEILGLIMLGYTNHQVAEKLFISYETVRSHRKNILMKTVAKNTAALVNHYHQTFFEK